MAISVAERDVQPRIGVTLTADRIFGRSLSLADCIAALRGLRLDAVVCRIVLLLHINARIFMDPETEEEVRLDHLGAFVRFMFDATHSDAVWQEVALSSRAFRPLSDQALLATLELAVTVCPRDTGRCVESDTDRLLLTHIILSFQTDLLSRQLAARLKSVGDLAGLSDGDFAEFVRNRAAHNTRAYYRHAMGRLFGICCIPEIGHVLQQRMRRSRDNWFEEYMGMSAPAYFRAVFLLIAPALQLNLDKPDAQRLFFRPERFFAQVREPARSDVLSLLSLSTCTKTEFTPDGLLQLPIGQYLYRATRFHVTPILDIGVGKVCVSPTLLLNKFITGLPYLAQECRKSAIGRPLSLAEIKDSRAAFGHLFESYVIWLVRQWFKEWKGTEIISPYYCQDKTERDLVIVRRDAAFAIEIKASAPTLDLRQTGHFQRIDSMIKSGSIQVKRAAEALLTGRAVRSDATRIIGIRRVIPCVLTYDGIQLIPPLSDFYEAHLERELNMSLFQEKDGIYPLQFMDAEFLESWETAFDLSPESGSPFGYLETRARNPILRYTQIDGAQVVGQPRQHTPRPLEALIKGAFDAVETDIRSLLLPT